MIEIRPFTRRDREQLGRFVSAHLPAAIPGASLPSSVLLDQLERPVGEPVVGPWVQEQATLVAIEADQVAAAAHLRRYVETSAPATPTATPARWCGC
jgi:hypothetical protein